MAKDIGGNIQGLAAAELRSLSKLAQRRVGNEEIIPREFAREIYEVASKLSRRIGVLITREGNIAEVFVGTKEILYLPDLGRYRLGHGRLRRLRLVFSDLTKDPEQVNIPQDIYTDLEKLRLDMVVGIKEARRNVMISYAYNLPYTGNGAATTKTESFLDINEVNLNFAEFMEDLEAEVIEDIASQVVRKPNSAVLVGVYGRQKQDASDSMAELSELARTAGLTIIDTIIQKRDPDPKTLLGTGKLEELNLRCLRTGADMIVFDTELKPSQWRAITNATELKVIDRSMLILDIFAGRATSSDGRLQVELAQLRYNMPKLVEQDEGLSRLGGGIGGRGPGETKLELGRRRIRDRISELERRIDKLAEQRELRRQKRRERGMPVVAIIGYTNVGKSTLFNVLTKSAVLAENKLFATLEPARRRCSLPLPNGERIMVILADTVGFIRELPQELANAFRATLEELTEACLLVHVVDGSDPNLNQRMAAVESVLSEMELVNVPKILAINKVDKVTPEVREGLCKTHDGLAICAVTKEGLDVLGEKIATMVQSLGVAKEGIPADLEDEEEIEEPLVEAE